MAYVTQYKAEAWKEVLEAKGESNILQHRSKYPPMVVPPDCIALTCGIDVQKIGFWFVVRAWEPDLTSHNIMYGYLSTFADVENLIFNTRFAKYNSDETLGIWRAAMDTGGGVASDDEWTRTEEIYQWLRKNGRGVVWGIKGASKARLKRVDVTVIDKMKKGGRVIPGGLELRMLDVSQFKDLLHWRLTRKEATGDQPAESQRFYLHAETGMDYALQFLAEEKRRNRRRKIEWVQIRGDNHLLDCEVYAAACADSEWMPSFQWLIKNMQKEPRNQPPTSPKPTSRIKLW
jgi:phage terminase large subunit GpA-like protein